MTDRLACDGCGQRVPELRHVIGGVHCEKCTAPELWINLPKAQDELPILPEPMKINLVGSDSSAIGPGHVLDGRIRHALSIAYFGQFDGDHHKLWAIDQIVRVLTGENYKNWVAEYEKGEDGRQTYSWETGIAP